MPKVISADPTPNENAMKFTLAARIADSGKTFANKDAAEAHPIAKAVFALGGIKSVFMVADFVTVTKLPDGDWGELEERVIAAINGAG